MNNYINIDGKIDEDNHKHWIWRGLGSLLIGILFITGIPIKNGEGQYKGYVTAVERTGAVFVGYNVYLKTDLTSSNEDKACIDRNNKQLIQDIMTAQENKENVTLEYQSVVEYGIGVCPGASWMITDIK